jgi:WD40 repeat protein
MYEASSSHQEEVHFDLSKIDQHTAAIVLFVDGGPRNFQFVQSVIVHCSQENVDSDSSNFMSKVEPGAYSNALLFESASRARKDFQGVALNVIFRDGWNEDGTCKWHIKNIFEPLYVPTSREKDERCAQIVITTVPSLDKYRPRLFPSVKAVCSALSSTSLPKLKKCFQRGNGLPIKQFTEVLFQQLYETNPRVAEDDESGYTVALLQDMFSQIDFNGDGAVDWDEFTTFCIHTGLVGSGASSASDGPSASTKDTLDDYVIEYGEDNELKDTTLNSYSPLAGMRYDPSTKRILVTPEKRDHVMMFDENFQLICTLDPHKLNDIEAHEKLKVYDCLYIASKDSYVYCASDHTIVVCKEKCSLAGKKIHYSTVHRIYSSYLHVKLCWSEASGILCTVAADNVIYGWNLEGNVPIFHVSRHKELITDFIAIDSLELFATCSLDKRIVLWSQNSRRVKGVLLGHKRGVRVLSHAKGVLLSAGFECDARTWDINLREPTLILKGHRLPISAARMMCAPDTSDDNLRALTVDDGGEFRLWNVYVKEKGAGCGFAQVLQVFTTNASEPQVGRMKFFELPFHPISSKGNYSDIIAASSKLVHIIPEKNAAEFVPPTCVCYSEPNACIVTAIGRSLYKYDVSAGSFQAAVNDVDGSDVTYLALDGEYGRRIFVGCTSGNIMLLNFATGQILDSVEAHTKEVSSISVIKTHRTLIFSGSFDGKIRCIEESGGSLLMHNTADNAFDDGSGITVIKPVESVKIVIAASAGRKWGVWNMLTLKRIILIEERESVSSIEILGASGDKVDIDMHMHEGTKMDNTSYVSFAVCTLSGIRVYVMDTFNVTIAITHELSHKIPMYISGMTLLRCPQQGSVNYTENHATSCARFGLLFVAIADEGFVLVWKAEHLRRESFAAFVKLFPPENDESAALTRANSMCDSIAAAGGGVDAPESIAESITAKLEELGPFGNCENSGDEITANGDAEADVADSVFSLTTTGSEASSASPNKEKRLSSLESHKKRRNKRRAETADARRRSVTTSSLGNHLIVGEECKEREFTIKSWRAHRDIVQDIVPLHEHGCFVTISLDGFNRIWNLDSELLGELPLPNVTEKMKSTRLSEEPTKWKFILEKIPVTKSHRDIAARLVKILTQAETPREEKERRKGGLPAGFGELTGLKPAPIKMKRTVTSDARDVLRTEILTKLNEVESVMPESAEGSMRMSLPEISPVKTSKRGMQEWPASCGKHDSDDELSSISDGSSVKFVRGKMGSDGLSVTSMTSDLSKSQRSFASISTMWIDSQSLHTSQSAPFSEASITLSHQEGLIDGEGHKILRRVNADKDKVEAYNRSVPTVSLRNVGLSTAVAMPPKGSSAESEVSFGTQKVRCRYQ